MNESRLAGNMANSKFIVALLTITIFLGSYAGGAGLRNLEYHVSPQLL